MLEETNRYYDQTVAALGGLDNLPPASRLWDRMPVDLPCMKAFLAIFGQLKQTISSKMALAKPTNVAKEIIYPTMYFVLCIVCCVVYCLLCITVLCCAKNQMQICSTKFNIFFIKTKIYFL